MRQRLRIVLAGAQWLLLTVALAAVVVRASSATRGLVDPQLDGSWVVIGAFLTALLLGITIESPALLAAGVALQWLAASGARGLLVMLPVWDGTIARTDALVNDVINQLVVLPLLLALPGAFGALAGSLLRRLLGDRQELLPPPRADQPRTAWWDR